MLIVTLLAIPTGAICLLVSLLCVRRNYRVQALLFAGTGIGLFIFAGLMAVISYLFCVEFL